MKTIVGYLLEIESGCILHQVNCRGATGGLAGALYWRWPLAFADYFDRCQRDRASALGTFLVSECAPGLRIGHVFGQLEPGPTTELPAVLSALSEARWMVDGPVYAPYKMGCGIGGGNWADYSAALEAAFPEIIIVQREEDARHG